MGNPQGVRAEDYTVVPRTLIFAVHEDHVLLLKGAPHKRLWAGRYNGVGGHVRPGEDAFEAALREFREETGLNLERLWLCGTVFIDTGRNPGVLLLVFRGETAAREQPRPSPEGQAQWLPIDEVHHYPLVEDLFILLPRVLNWRPGEPAFHALYTYDDQGRLSIRFGGLQAAAS